LVLGSIDLCCSIFVLFERTFIAALDVWPSNLSKYRAKLPRPANAPYLHPCRQQWEKCAQKNRSAALDWVFYCVIGWLT